MDENRGEWWPTVLASPSEIVGAVAGVRIRFLDGGHSFALPGSMDLATSLGRRSSEKKSNPAANWSAAAAIEPSVSGRIRRSGDAVDLLPEGRERPSMNPHAHER